MTWYDIYPASELSKLGISDRSNVAVTFEICNRKKLSCYMWDFSSFATSRNIVELQCTSLRAIGIWHGFTSIPWVGFEKFGFAIRCNPTVTCEIGHRMKRSCYMWDFNSLETSVNFKLKIFEAYFFVHTYSDTALLSKIVHLWGVDHWPTQTASDQAWETDPAFSYYIVYLSCKVRFQQAL